MRLNNELADEINHGSQRLRCNCPETRETGVHGLTEYYKKVISNFSATIDAFERETGIQCQCTVGCDGCCWGTMITISYGEALIITEYLMNVLSRRPRELVFRRISETLDIMKKSGLSGEQIAWAQLMELNTFYSLREQYFRLGLPCIFLQDRKCLIYEVRPLDCCAFRQYSSRENCRNHKVRDGADYHTTKQQILFDLENNVTDKTNLANGQLFLPLSCGVDAVINGNEEKWNERLITTAYRKTNLAKIR